MIWLLIGFINLVFAFLNLCLQVARKKSAYGVVTSLVILCCPIVSVVVLLVAWITEKIFFRNQSKKLNVDELTFKKERVKLVVAADIKQEIEKVPVEEALLASDKFSKRETILNILKGDYSDSLTTIRKAVDDWDSEIAHYAATTITDVIQNFKNREMEMREELAENGTPEAVMDYMVFVEDFLEKHLLPDFEFRNYVLGLNEYMEWTKSVQYEYFNSEICNRLVRLLMECKEFDMAGQWLSFLFSTFEEDLETYKSGLRFFYVTGRNKKFMELLSQLKASSLILDAESLEWVRFFN